MLRSFHRILLFILIAGNVLVYRAILAPDILEVRVLDVGEKGSAILVRSPSGKTLLIDAGRDAGILRALGSTLPPWQRSIDAVLVTNKSTRSAGGLPEVIDRYRIGTLVRSAVRGERLTLGDGVYVDILWPPQTASTMYTENGALALRISYGATSFLIQNLPSRISKWLAVLDADLPPPSVVISSSTPPTTYTSNGEVVAVK